MDRLWPEGRRWWRLAGTSKMGLDSSKGPLCKGFVKLQDYGGLGRESYRKAQMHLEKRRGWICLPGRSKNVDLATARFRCVSLSQRAVKSSELASLAECPISNPRANNDCMSHFNDQVFGLFHSSFHQRAQSSYFQRC